MYDISINELSVLIRGLDIVNWLNGFLSVVIRPSGAYPPLAMDDPATLATDDGEFSLVVDDFTSDWVRLVAPGVRAAPFSVEIFSGDDGTTFKTVIESRCAVDGPPSLSTKWPAVVVDCTLPELLNDLCFREASWGWWTEKQGLGIGPIGLQTTEADGTILDRTGAGTEVRLAECAPPPGTILQLPCGTSGVVLRSAVAWRAGAEPIYTAMLGAAPKGQRRAPRSTVTTGARVIGCEPFRVEIIDEERPDRTFRTQARWMVRESDEGCFHEDLPVKSNDVFEVVLPTGGVSTLPPKVYSWKDSKPSDRYCLTARSAEVVVVEKVLLKATDIEETFTGRESHVAKQWNIRKQKQ